MKVFITMLAVILVAAVAFGQQVGDSESDSSQPANIGGAWQLSCRAGVAHSKPQFRSSRMVPR
jgi:hypothetical protein